MQESSVIYFDQLPQSQPGSDMYVAVDGSLMQWCYTRQLDAEANRCLFTKRVRGRARRRTHNGEKPEYVSETLACI